MKRLLSLAVCIIIILYVFLEDLEANNYEIIV